MITKKLPACAGVSAVVGLTAVSALGKLIKIAIAAKDVPEVISKVKETVDGAKTITNELSAKKYAQISIPCETVEEVS